ncbi:hypothetical protein [Roseomonas sp. BN140053]|uniref:hypothetical protein n=1 Tax=Roseomonas sp. BN140053 TaxID=3391898 RepID=UPI0039ED3406
MADLATTREGFSPPPEHRLPDAADEARRLQSLLLAHGPLTVDALGETLVAAAFGGARMKRNNADFDVRCPRFGLVEVRSRVLGTDGWLPRLTLRKAPLGVYDHVAALRFALDLSFWRGVILPTAALIPLYEARKQASGIAHIAWNDAVAHSAALDITGELRAVIAP